MFHVFLSSGGFFSGEAASEFDLSEEELQKRFLQPREHDESIWVQGKEFTWGDAEFRIFLGPPTSEIDEFTPILGSPMYELNGTFEDVTGTFVTSGPGASGQAPTSESERQSIFVVHGRNEALKVAVARCVETLVDEGRVLILHEQPNSGASLIEKFERSANEAAFAIVILTSDDVGGSPEGLQPRARQNVVFEAGYFFGAIGRENVALLYEEGVELPSDVHGLAYIPIDQNGAWQMRLGQELRAAGIDADLNKIAL